MLSPSTFACRTACWALGGPVRAARRAVRSGTAALSPAAQAPLDAVDLQVGVGSVEPALARPAAGRSRASTGLALTPAVHTMVSASNSSPSDEHDVPVDAGLEPGVEPDLDAALAQLLDGVAAHVLADLGQDPVGRLDEHPAQVARVDSSG